MKHVLMRLVPWLLAACTVDTPVVEGNDDDRLEKHLGAWCQSWCDTFEECSGDSRALCLDGCLELFSRFAGKGSVCSEAGLRVMDCLEVVTCEEVDENPSACQVADELFSCLESAGETICQGALTNDWPTQDVLCTVGFDECSHGREYSLECLSDGESAECTCSVSGLTTGRFTPSELYCPFVAEAIQICAWPLLYTLNEQPPTFCDLGGGELSGSDGSGCSTHYGDCSDGREYEVSCLGTVGNVVCECSVDGQTVRSYESPTGICPFVQDSDAGRVAANAGCGFKIAPVEF